MMLKYGLRPSDISPVLLKYSLKRLGPRRALLKELRLPHTVASLKKWASITGEGALGRVLGHGGRASCASLWPVTWPGLFPHHE